MKKVLASFLAVILIASALVFTASAADNEWEVYASVDSYKDESEYESDNERPKEPGFRYTDAGVSMYSATHEQLDAMGVNAYGGLQLKEKVKLTDGFSMTAVIDKYTDNPQTDKWIAFCIWTQPKATPGNSKNGEGWLCLCRPDATTVKIQSYLNFVNLKAQPVVDTNIYDGDALVLEVKRVDGKLKIFVNDEDMNADAVFSKFENDEAYVSVVLHQGNRDELGVTITEVNGVKPTGTESKEPFVSSDAKPREAGPEVEAGQPCWLYTADDVKKGVPGTGMTSVVNDDGSLHIKFTGDNNAQFNLSVKKYLYEAQEFPIWAIKFKSLDDLLSVSSLFFCAGEVLAAQDNSVTTVFWSDSDYEEDDGWRILTVDLSGENTWEGNINNFRFDIAGAGECAGSEFDLAWIGLFRTEEDAYRYAGFGDMYASSTEAPQSETAADTAAPDTSSDTEADPSGTEPAPTDGNQTDKPETATEVKTGGKGGKWIIPVVICGVAAVVAIIVIVIKKIRKK